MFRKCFVTCEEFTCAKTFRNAIVRAFATMGGVLWEELSDKQLRQYLMAKTEEVYESEDRSLWKKAALIFGKQPDSNTYVLGEHLQV